LLIVLGASIVFLGLDRMVPHALWIHILLLILLILLLVGYRLCAAHSSSFPYGGLSES